MNPNPLLQQTSAALASELQETKDIMSKMQTQHNQVNESHSNLIAFHGLGTKVGTDDFV